MGDYISRDMAIARLTKVEVTNRLATMTDAKREIAEMPAADVAPVRRGHWIKYDDWEMCSECGGGHEWIGFGAAYCDECGAKMEVADD